MGLISAGKDADKVIAAKEVRLVAYNSFANLR